MHRFGDMAGKESSQRTLEGCNFRNFENVVFTNIKILKNRKTSQHAFNFDR